MHIRTVVVVNTGLKFNSGAWLDDSLHGSQQQQTCANSKKTNNNAGYIFLYGEPRGGGHEHERMSNYMHQAMFVLSVKKKRKWKARGNGVVSAGSNY
jgi:hypothetical protein